jgi:hypothetical protein
MRSAAGRASSSAPSMDIDLKRQSFPLCVVWCPIPVITHLFPPIGHLGVCFSDGEILDFLGPKFVHRGSLGFGSVARYWRLDPKRWLANGEDVSNESSAAASSAADAAFDRGVAAHDAAVARASSFFSKQRALRPLRQQLPPVRRALLERGGVRREAGLEHDAPGGARVT